MCGACAPSSPPPAPIRSKPCTASATSSGIAEPVRAPPRLRTVLLVINLLILLLPLGGIVALRVYESALVRQTESELVAQGAFVASAYRRALERAVHPTALRHHG